MITFMGVSKKNYAEKQEHNSLKPDPDCVYKYTVYTSMDLMCSKYGLLCITTNFA